MALQILNTEIRGSRILILHPNAIAAEEIEAHFEQNSEFSGVHIYTASTLEEGRVAARKYGIHLAIFPQYLGERDFVAIQQELRNAQPSIEMIPLLSTPTVAQLRESRGIGGVVDFGDVHELSSKDGLRNVIFGYLREKRKNSLSSKRAFEFADQIQRALLVEHIEWINIKELSRSLINPIVAVYDFSSEEVISILAAEMIYMPWIKREQYPGILGSDCFNIGEILAGTSSWLMQSERPTRAESLVIVLANYVAEKVAQRQPLSEIVQPILQGTFRPEFLKHPAIRSISETVVHGIAEVVSQVCVSKPITSKLAGAP